MQVAPEIRLATVTVLVDALKLVVRGSELSTEDRRDRDPTRGAQLFRSGGAHMTVQETEVERCRRELEAARNALARLRQQAARDRAERLRKAVAGEDE